MEPVFLNSPKHRLQKGYRASRHANFLRPSAKEEEELIFTQLAEKAARYLDARDAEASWITPRKGDPHTQIWRQAPPKLLTFPFFGPPAVACRSESHY